MDSHKTALKWYRQFLKLFPKSYRDEYEDEVVGTFAAMLEAAQTPAERREVWVLTVRDYVTTLSSQGVYATTTSYNMAPQSVKRDMVISIALIVPFFAVFLYNVLSLTVHHVIVPDIQQLEAHTWIIYSVIMPLIALVLITTMCVRRVYVPLRQHHWRQAGQVVFKDWLFAGVAIAFFALVAIF